MQGKRESQTQSFDQQVYHSARAGNNFEKSTLYQLSEPREVKVAKAVVAACRGYQTKTANGRVADKFVGGKDSRAAAQGNLFFNG